MKIRLSVPRMSDWYEGFATGWLSGFSFSAVTAILIMLFSGRG
jgi:hypothetical protein